MIRTVIRAYRRGIELGEARQRAEVVRFLRAQAAEHYGQVGDQRRRAALNYAATLLEQGQPVGRQASARDQVASR